MSAFAKKKVVSKTQVIKTANKPSFQHEQSEQLAHLTTLLLLTQLNSTYYQLALSFRKTTKTLQNKYKKLQLHAFLRIKHSKPNQIDIRALSIQSAVQQKQRQKLKAQQQLQLNLVDEVGKTKDLNAMSLTKIDKTLLTCQMAINCELRLSKMVNMISKKMKGSLSLALHRIQNSHQYVSANILSEKSSRIDTNDSQKSKIFKRSVERQQLNRKSFSLDKSTTHKREYHVPVKYQRSKDPKELFKQEVIHKLQNSPSSSSLNKFLQDRGQAISSRGRRNLVLGSEKKVTKSSSSKRLNMSEMQNERQQKANELIYLRTKYKKLMDEFNWFSDRFLKVIQEQDGLQ